MRKNIIKGVKPYNHMLFRNCYYHQLISGLAAFNVDSEDIVLSYFYLPYSNFGVEDVEAKRPQEECPYKITDANISKRKIIKFVDSNRPVIVGVDCFYIKERKETYKRSHQYHYILVYGYDLETKTFNIIDHSYLNDFNYMEKQIPIEELIQANRSYKKRLCKKNTTSFLLTENKIDRKPLYIPKHLKYVDIIRHKRVSKENSTKIKS